MKKDTKKYINLENDISFFIELEKLKSIYRQAVVKSDQNRFENSAEHSWHAMICAYALKDYFVSLNYDFDRALKMLLIHDVVEIDAGDTFVYDSSKILSQQDEKEAQAANRIFSLPNKMLANELSSLWYEFDENKTDTALFANAIDKFTPFILNVFGGGGTWRNNSIKSEQVLKRNENLKTIAPPLWIYLNDKVKEAIEKGWLV
ncbi:MAG: HD domain-containing protein [Gammaproteobacteria bacterium]